MICDDLLNSICKYCNGKSLIKLACMNNSSYLKINNYINDITFPDIFYSKNRIMITFFFIPILNRDKINENLKKYIDNALNNNNEQHYINIYKNIKNKYFRNGHDIFFEIFNYDILKKSKQFNDEIYNNISSNDEQWNDFYIHIKKINYDFKKFIIFIQNFKQKLNANIVTKILIDMHSHKNNIKYVFNSLKHYADKQYVTRYVLNNLNIYNVDKFFEIIDWDLFSNHPLNFYIINRYKDNINWNIYSRNIKNKYINKFEKYIVWSEIYQSDYLSLYLENDIIEKYCNKPWNWAYILQFKKISNNCLTKITKNLNFNEINVLCQFQVLNDEYINLHYDIINWNIVCKYQKLSVDIIKNYLKLINWDIFSECQQISYEIISYFDKYLNWTIILNTNRYASCFLIEKYHEHIFWNEVLYFNNVSENLLIFYKDVINWNNFQYEKKLSNETIKKLYDKLNIEKLIKNNNIDIDTFIILKRYSDKNIKCEIDWVNYYANNNYILDENQIVYFKDFVTWDIIVKKQILNTKMIELYSDDFNENEWIYMIKNYPFDVDNIIKYSEYIKYEIIFCNCKFENKDLLKILEFAETKSINMDNIYDIVSEKQILSEEFIENKKDRVNWKKIWKYQSVSVNFIRTYIHKVIWKDVCKYQILDEEFIRDFHKKVSWMFISIYQKLSDDFIIEFSHKMDKNKIKKYQNINFETYMFLDLDKI